jgi:lysyl-tRNA synthetase class I
MLFNAPSKPGEHVPYNLLTFLAKMAPEGSETSFIMEKLQGYGYGKLGLTGDLEQRIGYALNWTTDFTEIKEKAVELNETEKNAVEALIQALQTELDEEAIQSAVFNIARNSGIKPGKFFKTLYRILLGVPQGPRLGPYILAMGTESVIAALKRAAKS